jgi:hypothetical protein
MEVAEHLLLFGVEADHRMPGALVLLFEFSDVFKLCNTNGVLTHRPFLLWLPTAIPMLMQ